MKKFYKEVGVREDEGSFSVCLDGRPVKTPAKNSLAVPNNALADAIAEEWRTDADEIDPAAMPLTRLANSAIDRVSAHRGAVIDDIAGFAATDLLCYRSSEPPELRDRQDEDWGEILTWLKRSREIDLKSTESVLPLDQDRKDLETVRHVVASFDDFSLAGLHMVTSACGSVALGLATADGEINGDRAWELSLLEETYQINEWGEDPEATKRRANLRADIGAAARFLSLLREQG